MYITDVLDIYDGIAVLFIVSDDSKNKKYVFLSTSLEKEEYLVFDLDEEFNGCSSSMNIQDNDPYLCEINFSDITYNWIGTKVSLLTKIKLTDEELIGYLPLGE